MSHGLAGAALIGAVLSCAATAQAKPLHAPPMPGCYDPRPPICTARIAPCWADYDIVTKACKKTEGECSQALIAQVTADWVRAEKTCTHTAMPK
ncbi:MAG: hypothetical protein ACREFK_10755 [Stellaceae bacterium]